MMLLQNLKGIPMKERTLNTKSLHYKIANLAGFNSYEEENMNICAYTKALASGVLLLLLMASMIAVAGSLLSNLVIGIVFSIMYKVFFFTEIGIVAISVLVMVAACTVFMCAKIKNERYYSAKVGKEESFVFGIYDAWKNKFCIKLKVMT
jgi:hypothetical protein